MRAPTGSAGAALPAPCAASSRRRGAAARVSRERGARAREGERGRDARAPPMRHRGMARWRPPGWMARARFTRLSPCSFRGCPTSGERLAARARFVARHRPHRLGFGFDPSAQRRRAVVPHPRQEDATQHRHRHRHRETAARCLLEFWRGRSFRALTIRLGRRSELCIQQRHCPLGTNSTPMCAHSLDSHGPPRPDSPRDHPDASRRPCSPAAALEWQDLLCQRDDGPDELDAADRGRGCAAPSASAIGAGLGRARARRELRPTPESCARRP